MNVFIAIDPDVCMGVGKCEELEPNAVEIGDDSISRPREGIALPEERARRLCTSCPSGAIAIAGPAPNSAQVP